MNNYTTNTYEMKREIINFSKKISIGLKKPTGKFISDMQHGLSKGGSCLVSETARALDEDIKLNYTIERLCDNLNNLSDEEKEMVTQNTTSFLLTSLPVDYIIDVICRKIKKV